MIHEDITLGPVRLIRGDCTLIAPTLEGVDAVITDPPYGIGYVPYQQDATQHAPIHGDDKEFDPSMLLAISAPLTIIWGANNFTTKIPIGGWLCWDKRTNEAADRCIGSPFELAWINNPRRYKIARIMHGGAVNADGIGTAREHPTQKPIRLMMWCIEQGNSGMVLDPYMGSGTTLIAAIRTGRRAIGIEIDERHFRTAVERVKRELAQPMLPAMAPQRVEQQDLIT